MLRARLFERRRGGIKVYADPQKRLVAVRMTIAGVAVALASGLLSAVGDPSNHEVTAWAKTGLIVAGCLIGIGGIAWIIKSSGAYFDRGRRTVYIGGKRYPYDKFVAVRVRRKKLRTGGYDQTYFYVELIEDVGDAIVKLIERHIAARGKKHEAVPLEQSDEELLSSVWYLRVAFHIDEDSTFRLSERIAKELDVPQLDLVGKELELRLARELDMPLTERLGRDIEIPDDVGELPKKASIDVDGSATTISFRTAVVDQPPIYLGLGGFIAAVLWLALGGLSWTPQSVPWLYILGGCVGGIAILVFGPRQATLLINPSEVRYRGPWGMRRRLSTQSVETLHSWGWEVALVSDERSIRCRPIGATWLYKALLQAFARTRPDSPDGPYR